MTPELQKLYDRLVPRQKKFVDLWNGQQTETARMAGYKDPFSSGVRNLQNPSICKILKHKSDEELKPKILTRLQRQRFWSKIMLDENEKIKDRLAASRLLGMSEGDFIERVLKSDVPYEKAIKDLTNGL